MVGPDAGLGDRARAIVALGGLSDCLVLLADTPVEELRVAALDAACAALNRRPPASDSAAPARRDPPGGYETGRAVAVRV
ncbi:hypothetical protein ACIG56_04615 [Nocardia fusca]|uniref:hypothetical protein n=1 Tax=Nocardia fusca TaxID=941183 RepID=UPI0037CA68CD